MFVPPWLDCQIIKISTSLLNHGAQSPRMIEGLTAWTWWKSMTKASGMIHDLPRAGFQVAKNSTHRIPRETRPIDYEPQLRK